MFSQTLEVLAVKAEVGLDFVTIQNRNLKLTQSV